MDLVRLKTRSVGQILEKPCVRSRGHIFSQIIVKLGQNVGVLLGSVVTCLTRNPEVLGLSRTGSSGFVRGSVLGQDTSEPQPSTCETQEDVNNVNCRGDMTEISQSWSECLS